ncbi:MAG: selenium cofactor biosynthesis protein YqeC [Clostridia bacterium]
MEDLYSLINIELERKEMICLVGAGGKTSAMFRLARELSSKGKKILATTTTAIYYPEQSQYDEMIISEEESLELFDNISNCGITILGRTISSEGKLFGVSPKFLDAIFLEGIFDYILVEGDGSRGKPVKAPAEYEPVIPSLTAKLIGLIGLDCVGKEVCMDNVHRPEFFCSLLDCSEGDIIDAELVQRLILHKYGLFKAAPANAQKYLVLNKAEVEKERIAAADIVQKLLDKKYNPEEIVIASMKDSSFRNAVKIVSGIILAAGLSKRMGGNKLLLPVGGVPVIERVLAAASGSMLGEVILVCASDEIASIGRRYGAKIVYNTAPQLGQSQSVRLGAENSCPTSAGLMFLVGDQPFITDSIINKLIERFLQGNCSAVVPLYNGKRGNPVIFSALLREKLLSLQGDAGGRTLLEGLEGHIDTVGFDNGNIGFDIDTPEEYESALKLEVENG